MRGATTLAQGLSRHVVEALVKLGLTERDVLGGAIKFTELPWQIPPLIVEATLFGAPLSEYIDRPTHVSADALINFFSDGLADMRNAPRKVLTLDGYRGVGAVIPDVRIQERQLHFSIPDGFPGAVSDYAGVTFALECAHLARTNVKIKNFVNDDDNYYADLGDDVLIGVKDGLPAMWGDQWDLPVSGMVQDLLRNPRGEAWEGCDYNVVSQVRSVITIHKDKLQDYEALDWALQALRVIGGEAALLHAMRSLKKVAFERETRMATLRDAVKLSKDSFVTDRQRIEALKNMLVPELMTAGEFTKQLYSFYRVVPPVIHPKVLDRIQQTLQDMLVQEEALYARINPGNNATSST